MTTNFVRRRYGLFERKGPILKWIYIYYSLASQCQILSQNHKWWLHVGTKFCRPSVFYSNFISSLLECDALIVTSSYAYESLSLDALKQWFSEMKKEVHVLGPLLPPGCGIKPQNGEEGSSVDIETFLGEMLLRHGERSVFFVRSLHFLFISYIILLRFPLALTPGHQFRNTLRNCSNPLLQRKHHL